MDRKTSKWLEVIIKVLIATLTPLGPHFVDGAPLGTCAFFGLIAGLNQFLGALATAPKDLEAVAAAGALSSAEADTGKTTEK